MSEQTVPAVDDSVAIVLYNDREDKETQMAVTPKLATLLAYADAWAREQSRDDAATLTFSSTLASMVAGDHALCRWFRLHLALRGSTPEEVTKNRTFRNLQLPASRLTTSHSFRRALAKARKLAGCDTLDVKHLMAAYPVVKSYHAGDFLRLRIDRRAWCLALADHMQRTESSTDATDWFAYAALAPEVLLPRYLPDLPAGADLLGVGREVEAFAMLLASAHTSMPLSIGVFGAWGSGKSYFMARIEERVSALAHSGSRNGPYLRRIAHVRFNAWHYSEGDVVASMVDQIFRNLRFGPTESTADLARRRSAALGQVAAADAEWRDLKSRVDAAAEEESRLRDEWQRISAEHDTLLQQTTADLAAAQSSVAAAEKGLEDALAAQEAAVSAARRAAPVKAAAQLVADTILKDPTIAALNSDVRRVAEEARWIGANRFTIGWGAVAVALTAVGASMAAHFGASTLATTMAGAIIAVLPLATKAVSVLRELAAKGAALQSAIVTQTDAAVAAVRAQHEQLLASQELAVQNAQSTVATLRSGLDAAAAAAHQAEGAHAAVDVRRRQLAEQMTAATAAAAATRRALDALTLGSLLGDTIQEAADTEVFRKRLGTLSYARGFFQRLSETMRAARDEAANGGTNEPALERVVLYIDDLDRCPEDQVLKVLQAVHLLLAFDLFACVVAADPRWILECLEKSPGVISNVEKHHARDTDLDVLGGLTTPSDYLEKIFQIPLWLRPMPPERRAPLAATLLDQEFGLSAIDAHAKVDGPAFHADRPVPMPPEVQISAGEIQFLQTRVARLLIGNARALKRFVNTYHLVKAALSEVEFDEFAPKSETDDARRDSYRVCMVQLALLAADRGRARLLAKLVDAASRSAGSSLLKPWLEGLRSGENKDEGAIATDLVAALLPELDGLTVDRFAYWFERTRRYSFYL